MTRADAISYLAGTTQIPVREMSKPMFHFLRAAARRAGSIAGYYDPEFEGPPADPSLLRFRPALWIETLPQSPALRAKRTSQIVDPMADPFALFGEG